MSSRCASMLTPRVWSLPYNPRKPRCFRERARDRRAGRFQRRGESARPVGRDAPARVVEESACFLEPYLLQIAFRPEKSDAYATRFFDLLRRGERYLHLQ